MNIILHKQLDLLVQLARKDGKIHDAERAMILNIASKNNLNEQEIESLFEPHTTSSESLGALSFSKKTEYLISLIKLMISDDSVSKSEFLFCQELAIKMGFHKEIVKEVLKQIQSSNTIPDDYLKELIREYLL